MQSFAKSIVEIVSIGFPFLTLAQSTYLPRNHKQQQFLNGWRSNKRYNQPELFTPNRTFTKFHYRGDSCRLGSAGPANPFGGYQVLIS